VTREALEPFRLHGPRRTEAAAYLQQAQPNNYDMQLESACARRR
jgi:hypothetical protein